MFSHNHLNARLHHSFQPHAELCHESIKMHQRRDLASRHYQRASNLSSFCFRTAKKSRAEQSAHNGLPSAVLSVPSTHNQRLYLYSTTTSTSCSLNSTALYQTRTRIRIRIFRFFYPNPTPPPHMHPFAIPTSLTNHWLAFDRKPDIHTAKPAHKTNPAN